MRRVVAGGGAVDGGLVSRLSREYIAHSSVSMRSLVGGLWVGLRPSYGRGERIEGFWLR